MEKILCLAHQLSFISIDGEDVNFAIVCWDSDGVDVAIDSTVAFSGTIAGADAAQSLYFWISENVGDPMPSNVVGGVICVLDTSIGEGLAVSNSGVPLSQTHSRGFPTASAATPAGSPIKIAPGQMLVFGRERSITPAGGVGGSGASGAGASSDNHLPFYCLRALTTDATAVVEILDADFKTVDGGTITVAAASAKSAEVLVTAGLGTFAGNYRYMIIISISGGLTFWNRAGTGVPGVGDGVGTPAPTSTNALPLLPGMVLG